VLLNLQSNALKFTQKGKVEIKVSITDENFLKISVVDTGIGIKREDQDKLFKLFGFLRESQSMNTSGIGLGLVISQNIIKQYEGTITVDSEYGRGTAFTFTLKLEKQQEEEFKLEDEVVESAVKADSD
jgi:two-component system, sensor histidine kinase ChiS